MTAEIRTSIDGVRLALALAVITCAVAPSTAAAALSPPIIREPWTPLPCPAHAVSTVDLEGCLEKGIRRTDRQIDARVAKIFYRLRSSSDRRAFVRGERSWLQYRRSSCSAEASVYHGGSAEPVAFLTCEKRRNARHIADLQDMERILRRG